MHKKKKIIKSKIQNIKMVKNIELLFPNTKQKSWQIGSSYTSDL